MDDHKLDEKIIKKKSIPAQVAFWLVVIVLLYAFYKAFWDIPTKAMFDRYTEDARKVIFLARYEASRLGSPVLETGHLWLGLLRQSKKLIRRHVPKVTEESVLQQLKPQDPEAERVSMTVEIPLSDETKRALTLALEIADGHGQKHITSEYLILGLLREQEIHE